MTCHMPEEANTLVPALWPSQTLHVTKATCVVTMQADTRALQDGDEPGMPLNPYVNLTNQSMCHAALMHSPGLFASLMHTPGLQASGHRLCRHHNESTHESTHVTLRVRVVFQVLP